MAAGPNPRDVLVRVGCHSLIAFLVRLEPAQRPEPGVVPRSREHVIHDDRGRFAEQVILRQGGEVEMPADEVDDGLGVPSVTVRPARPREDVNNAPSSEGR